MTCIRFQVKRSGYITLPLPPTNKGLIYNEDNFGQVEVMSFGWRNERENIEEKVDEDENDVENKDDVRRYEM